MSQDTARSGPPDRSAYPHFVPLQTRWMDNDVYSHINNVIYYSYFDTAVNAYLVQAGLLDIERSQMIGLVVESGCRYHAPLAFPQALEAGLRIDRLGTSSVRYGVSIFAAGAQSAAADGHFVHVYVDRQTRRPVSLPQAFRDGLTPLLREVA